MTSCARLMAGGMFRNGSAIHSTILRGPSFLRTSGSAPGYSNVGCDARGPRRSKATCTVSGILMSIAAAQNRSSSGSGYALPFGNTPRLTPRSSCLAQCSSSATASARFVHGMTPSPMRRSRETAQYSSASQSLYARTVARYTSSSVSARQSRGPTCMLGKITSASRPSMSCSRRRCSGGPTPAVPSTVLPNGCHVSSVRPARSARNGAGYAGRPSPRIAPLRVRLLGEDLIAFRVSSGAVGLIQNSCPHRGASLFYGRNEAEGLRCVYHGWKFDVGGRCVDMPIEPAESNFKQKVRAVTYPCVERGGLIWTYLGPRPTPPPMPELEATMLADNRIQVYQRDCNWMQALEGDNDTGHTVYLHLGSVDASEVPPDSWARYALADRAPRYEVTDTDSGVMYGAYRPAEADTNYWRIANFLFPFYAMIPTGVLGLEVRVRAWVPMDDAHTLAFLSTHGGPPPPRNAGRQAVAPPETLPNTTDWYGRFRCAADGTNDYLIDRKAQKTVSFTGIGNIPAV